MKPPTLMDVNNAFDAVNERPIVSAIHGHAFGGGLELSLSCHYRCATKKSSFSLPDVQLGLMPGNIQIIK